MPVLLSYILKLSLSLAVVYLFYLLVLRKLTFYNMNRWYLFGYTLLSFLIPFINISPVIYKSSWATDNMITWVPMVETGTSLLQVKGNNNSEFNWWSMTMLIIGMGMLVFLLKLVMQFIAYRKMKKQAEPLPVNGVNIYQVNDNIVPFSFGNSIFINRNLHHENELQEIIQHEFIHVKQRHSIDIIWSELLCIINWYNPFAWMIKKAIRQNLEFIADNKVVETGISKKEYQYLLLKVIGNNQYSIATPFNYSSLKKRIAMMNKLKSTKQQLLRMLFLLPATALLLLAFRNRVIETTHAANEPAAAVSQIANNRVEPAKGSPVTAQLPADTIPERVELIATKAEALKALTADLKDILIEKNTITVFFPDGSKEIYNTEIASDKEAYEKKYGKLEGSEVATYLSPTTTERVILVDIKKPVPGVAEIALAKVPVNTVALTKPVIVEGKPVKLIATTKPLTVTGHPLNVVTGTKPVDLAASTPLKLATTQALTVAAYPPKKTVQIDQKADILDLGGLSLLNEGQYILLDGKEYTTVDKTLKGTYRITFLDKKEGTKKYGNKGINGVILLETISKSN